MDIIPAKVAMDTGNWTTQIRKGLLELVGKRRALLDYLTRSDIERYRNLIKKLKIRK